MMQKTKTDPSLIKKKKSRGNGEGRPARPEGRECDLLT